MNKMAKRALALAMMIALVVLPAAAMAATVSNEAELKSNLEAGTDVTLGADITLTESLNIDGKSVKLNLAGYTLNIRSSSHQLINGANLTINGDADKNSTVNFDNVPSAAVDAIFCVGHRDNGNNTLTINDAVIEGKDYHPAFGVFYMTINGKNTVNINRCTMDFENTLSGGSVFNAEVGHGVLNIIDSEVVFTDTERGIVNGEVLIKNSNVTIQAGKNDKLDNAINSGTNGLHLTVDNSTIVTKDGKGRGLTFDGGSTVTMKNNSTFIATGFEEADIRNKSTGSLYVDGTSAVVFETIMNGNTITLSGEGATKDQEGNLTVIAKRHTITYTDGVDGEEVFADQQYQAYSGEATPMFSGSVAARDGYKFIGWNPEIDDTVDGSVTYKAQWEKVEAPVSVEELPKTGDNSNIALFAALLTMSAAGMLLLMRRKSTQR